MRRFMVAAVMVAGLLVGPVAGASGATLATKYSSRYHRVVHQHRLHPQAIAHPGAFVLHKRKRATVAASADRMLRWLRQLRAPAPVLAQVVPEAPAPNMAAGNGQVPSTSGLPACASESGTNYSTGPSNTNPSGATGRYQEMPEHRASGGLCYGIDLSPAGQDRCAQIIYENQGAGAWVGCG